MRLLLLTSASVLGLSGAAMAQDEEPLGITFGGDASFGFNSFEFNSDEDVSTEDPEDEGFFYEANLSVTFRAILNNGAVATSTFTIPIADTNIGNDLSIDQDFVLGLSLEDGSGIFLGDVTFAAEDEFDFATMQSADFSEQDGETVVKGVGTLGDLTIAGSAIVQDADGDIPGEGRGGVDADGNLIDERTFIDQVSVGASGDVGRFSFSLGYQEESEVFGDVITIDGVPVVVVDEIGDLDSIEGVYDPFASNGDFNPAEQFGISAGTNFAGFDVQLGYGRNVSLETESYGVSAGFPVGPVTLTAEYVFEPDFDDDSYAIGAEYESDNLLLEASFGQEIGEEEYDVKVAYAFGPVTTIQAGYNDDDGGFVAYRQGLGAGAFVEASYAEADDVGFGNSDFNAGVGIGDDIRLGTTLRVGLEF